MATFKKDDKVKTKPVIITGRILSAAMDEHTFALSYLVEYVDENGESHQRYFSEQELELNND